MQLATHECAWRRWVNTPNMRSPHHRAYRSPIEQFSGMSVWSSAMWDKMTRWFGQFSIYQSIFSCFDISQVPLAVLESIVYLCALVFFTCHSYDQEGGNFRFRSSQMQSDSVLDNEWRNGETGKYVFPASSHKDDITTGILLKNCMRTIYSTYDSIYEDIYKCVETAQFVRHERAWWWRWYKI